VARLLGFMRGVPEETVRRWRAARWRLSRPAANVHEAVESLLPLPAAPSAYVSLFARCASFEPRDLDRLIFEERSLEVLPLHRRGPSLVPTEAAPCLVALNRFAWGSHVRRSRVARRANAALEATAPRVLARLNETPKTAAEVAAGGESKGVEATLRWLAGRGEVVMGFDPPSLFGSLTFARPRPSDRIPVLAQSGYEFLQEVALFYFRAAGPAARDDFLWWTALSRSAARHTIEDLAGILEEVDLEGARKANFMTEEDAAELREFRGFPVSKAALLPAYDPAGSHAREGFAALCEPRLRPKIAPGGRTKPRRPVLLAGSAVGTWAATGDGAAITFDLAKAVGDEAEASIQAAADSLGAFVRAKLAALPGAPASLRNLVRLL